MFIFHVITAERIETETNFYASFRLRFYVTFSKIGSSHTCLDII